MRNNIPLLLQLCCLSFFAQGQDTTRVVQNDSLQSKVVEITPYYSLEKGSAGNYFKLVDDHDVLQFSNGVSVFNSLRGRAPALFIPAYFADAGFSGMRTGYFVTPTDAAVIIDGIPFNNFISESYNLNGLDIASISAISNSNAIAFTASTNSGAFVLHSKSAEGLEKPTLEFNSSFSKGFYDAGTTTLNEKYFANSLTYSRDFGMMDTRISYTYLNQPLVATDPANIHNIKINTGITVNDKLKFRLIVTDQYSDQDIEIPGRTQPVVTDAVSAIRKQNYFSGNLTTAYILSKNFKLTSQVYYMDMSLDSSAHVDQAMFTFSMDKHNYLAGGNVFTNFNKTFEDQSSINFFAGGKVALQNYDLHAQQDVNGQASDFDWELKSTSPQFSAGGEFGYKDFLFLSGSFSVGEFSHLDDDEDRQYNYSITSAFIFTKFWRPDFLTFGKVRASYGSQEVVPNNDYPMRPVINPQFPFSRSLQTFSVTGLETGFDLDLLKSKVKMAFNYFSNKEAYIPPPFVINVLESYSCKGWEMDIQYFPVKKDDFSYQVGLLLSSWKSRLTTNMTGGNDSFSNPSWRNSLYNQLKWRNFILVCTIESLKENISINESSYIKLREISMGYQLPGILIGEIGLDKVIISVSGKNIYEFYGSGDEMEVPSYPYIPFQKSFTINLSVVF